MFSLVIFLTFCNKYFLDDFTGTAVLKEDASFSNAASILRFASVIAFEVSDGTTFVTSKKLLVGVSTSFRRVLGAVALHTVSAVCTASEKILASFSFNLVVSL